MEKGETQRDSTNAEKKESERAMDEEEENKFKCTMHLIFNNGAETDDS